MGYNNMNNQMNQMILIVVHLHLVHVSHLHVVHVVSHLLPLLHLVLVVGLGLLSFTPFILYHVVVFGNSLLNRRFILKCHESESFVWAARVVLVRNKSHFSDNSVPFKIVLNVILGGFHRNSSQENFVALGEILLVHLLLFLDAGWCAWFWVNLFAIQGVGSCLQHGCHGGGFGVCDKTEAPGLTHLVFHEDDCFYFTVLAEVGLESLVGSLPGDSSNKQFSGFILPFYIIIVNHYFSFKLY